MKAVQITQFGGPEVLQLVNVPDPTPAAGEILIKVEVASVNYSDIARRRNAIYPFPTPLPFIPGSEVAGVVAALGEGVAGPPVGTPVFALAGHGSNGYADYVATPAPQVIPIPPGVSPEQAVSLPVAGTTALMLVRETGQLRAGETILIQGAAGGVGSYAVQIAKLLGAGTLIGAVSSPAKFAPVQALGATHTIDYSQAGWAAQVHEITGGRGVDLLLEMNGGPTFSEGLKTLAPFARLIVYGMSSGQPLAFDAESVRRFFYDPSLNQSIHVFNLGLQFGMRPHAAAQAMTDLITYVAAGQIKVTVDATFPLHRAADAHRLMESRQSTGKILLKPGMN